MNKKWLILLAGTIILFNISCKKDPISSTPATVAFQDANFEALIREAINKPTEDILTTELLTIIKLDGEDSEISNITGIEHCTNLDTLMLLNNKISDINPLSALTSLTYLDLDENQISDISVLSGLENIRSLYLSDNQISDIYPLTQNSGFDDGSSIYLRNNPLSETSINTYIPQLEALGVTLTYGNGKVRSNISNKYNYKK